MFAPRRTLGSAPEAEEVLDAVDFADDELQECPYAAAVLVVDADEVCPEELRCEEELSLTVDVDELSLMIEELGFTVDEMSFTVDEASFTVDEVSFTAEEVSLTAEELSLTVNELDLAVDECLVVDEVLLLIVDVVVASNFSALVVVFNTA